MPRITKATLTEENERLKEDLERSFKENQVFVMNKAYDAGLFDSANDRYRILESFLLAFQHTQRLAMLIIDHNMAPVLEEPFSHDTTENDKLDRVLAHFQHDITRMQRFVMNQIEFGTINRLPTDEMTIKVKTKTLHLEA